MDYSVIEGHYVQMISLPLKYKTITYDIHGDRIKMSSKEPLVNICAN